MNPTVEQLLKDFVALGLGPTPAFEGEPPDVYRARFFYAFGSLQGRALNALSVARIAAERRAKDVRPFTVDSNADEVCLSGDV